MARAVRRYRLHFLSNLETDPISQLSGSLILEAVLEPTSVRIGERLQRWPQVLDELEKEPPSYWRHLIDHWFLQAPCIEIHMRPDVDLADQQAKEADKRDADRRAQLGKDGLDKQAVLVKEALEANKVDLPKEVLDAIPPTPSNESVPVLPNKLTYHWKSPELVPAATDQQQHLHTVTDNLPFSTALEVVVPTNFTYIFVGFDTAHVPKELRPYLFLLQEILLETDLAVPGKPVIGYRDVLRLLVDDVVNMENRNKTRVYIFVILSSRRDRV